MPDTIPGTTATTSALLANGAVGTSLIDVAGDQDWWWVNLVAGTSYTFRLAQAASGGLGDPYLRLLNASGGQVAFNDDADADTFDSLITYTPPASGRFYLSAQGYGSATGAYGISVDVPASTATPVGLTVNGGAVSNRVDTGSDQDWYRVSLAAGGTYTFALNSGASSTLDPYLRLLNGSGAQVTLDDDAGGDLNAQLTFTATATGNYYLSAQSYGGQSSGDYTIRAATDDFSATVATAGRAVVNGSASGRVNFAGDRDWFRATLTAGRTYTIRLKGSPSGAGTLSDPFLRGVYNANGVAVANTSNDDFGGSRESQITFTPTATGTYYVAAGAYESVTGTYRLDLTEQSNADIAASTATTATLAVNARRSSTIGASGDQDWFRVSLTAGQTYVVELLSNQSSATPLADPSFRGIYAANGTLIAGTANDDYGATLNSRVEFLAPATGTYYLAAGAYGTNKGDYVISLATRTNITDAVGDSPSAAGSVAIGAGGVAGSIDYARDTDWYGVSLTAGQAYVINVRGAQSGVGTLVDPGLVGVYTGTGGLIAGTGAADSAGSPEVQTTFRPTTSGTYYLAVNGGNDTTGTYRLSIEPGATTDVPANTTTTATVAVGGVFTGSLEAAGDVDWIRVSLTQGRTYQIQERGAPSGDGTLSDPTLIGVYGSAGQVIPDSANDDFGGSLNSQVTFTAPSTGSFYIAAAGYRTNTGTYKLAVSEAAQDTAAPLLQAISPADGSTGVAVGSNLTLGFNEAVRAGAGNILINGGGQSLSIPVTSSQVSFSGEQMTINPSVNLLPGVQYTVTMASGVVRDLAGNSFAGITSNTQFNFTTAAAGGAVDSWTVLVYIAADNDLERFSINDLNEMESVNLPANVNVVTLVDRVGGYDSSNGNWSDTRRGQIVHDTNTGTVTSFNGFQQLGELNTGSGQTLTNFLNWGTTNYQADHYALIVWDHGGGLSGTSWDNTSNDHLTTAELRTAVDAAALDRFDIIGFDACLQGMVEQAWDLRNLADVVVASEELIPGNGWAYDRFLGQLAANPSMTAEDLGRSIVTTYGQEYAGQSDITLSAVRTSALGTLNTRINEFVNDALAGATAADWTAMRNAASRSVLFPSADSSYNYRDLGGFMAEVGRSVGNATLRSDATDVANALDAAVFARSGTVAGATGLSIYLPYGSATVSSSYTATNHTFLASSQWENYLAAV